MPGLTDTDEVRATTRRLTDALYDWLCLPITAYERAAKNGQVPASREVPDMGKELARAVEQRDRLQSHLDSALAQIDSMVEVFQAITSRGVKRTRICETDPKLSGAVEPLPSVKRAM